MNDSPTQLRLTSTGNLQKKGRIGQLVKVYLDLCSLIDFTRIRLCFIGFRCVVAVEGFVAKFRKPFTEKPIKVKISPAPIKLHSSSAHNLLDRPVTSSIVLCCVALVQLPQLIGIRKSVIIVFLWFNIYYDDPTVD